MSDQASVSPITDDMVDAVEQAWPKLWLDADLDWRGKVRALLSAGLAGYTVVALPEDAEHLQVVRSDRGFSRLPALPTAYGGEIKVYESSAASAPHLWLLTTERDGHEAPAHLTVGTAHQLVQQLLHTIANHYQCAAGSQVGDQHGE